MTPPRSPDRDVFDDTTPALHWVVPGRLDQRTGGYLYDARMVRELRGRGWRVEVHEVHGSFPGPLPDSRDALDAALAQVPTGAVVVIDGLAGGAHPAPMERHSDRLRLLALVHHPLADETGTGQRERLRALESRTLAACRGVLVTSDFTAGRLADFGVQKGRIRSIPPGTAPAPTAAGPPSDAPPHLICVGAIIPRKGQDLLVEALGGLAHLQWRATCAGSLQRDPAFAGAVVRAAAAAGLEDRVAFPGELETPDLETLYHHASFFVLPSHYEGYGMALTEALSRGLPVVSTTGGAIPHTVPDGAGVLVPAGDADALAKAVARLLTDTEERGTRARAARAHAAILRPWEAAGEEFEGAVRELLGGEVGR